MIPNTREAKRVLVTMDGFIESAALDGDTLVLDRCDAQALHQVLQASYDVVCGSRTDVGLSHERLDANR